MSFSNFILKPETNSNIIERKRLQEQLNLNISSKLILISASAGYGKTTLLHQLHSNSPDHNICWIQGNEFADSQFALLKIFTDTFRHRNYDFGNEYYPLLDNFDKDLIADLKSYHQLLDLFIRDLSNLKEKTILIIDDYQILEKNDDKNKVNELLNYLIKYNFVNLTIILSSREEFNLKTSKLNARRNLFRLSTENLKFNLCEIALLAVEVYGLSPDKNELELLDNAVNGWAAALHLIFQRGKNWLRNLEIVKNEDIFSYFTEDIFVNLNEDARNFLLKTSVLNDFTEKDANELLNITNSASFIKQIEKKKVFIEFILTGENEKRYSYQKIFREYLLNKLNDTAEHNVFCTAAEYFYKNKDFKKFIFYALKSGQKEKAIKCFHETAFDFCRNNEFKLYLECLELFNGYLEDDDAFFIYHKFRIDLFSGNKTNVDDELLVNIHSGFISEYEINITLAEYYFFNNRFKEAAEIINFTIKGNIPESYILYCNYLLARNYYRMGSEFYHKASEICLNQTANQISNSYVKEFSKIQGDIYNDTGKIKLAIRYYEYSLSESGNFISFIKQIANLIDLYSTTGNFEKANEYLEVLKSLIYGIEISSVQNIYYRALIRFSNNIGDFDEAVKYLNISINESDTERNRLLLLAKYLELAETYWNQSKFSDAREIFTQAENILNILNPNEEFVVFIPYYRYFIADNSNNSTEAEKALLNLINWQKNNKMEKTLGYLYFNAAGFYANNGFYQQSAIYLKDAFDLIDRHELFSFPVNRLLASRNLFDIAVSLKIYKKLVSESFSRFFRKIELPFISKNFRNNLNSGINNLTDLKLFSFGRVDILLRGEDINEDKWIRKKSKILLVYLLSDPTRIHTKDEIVDIFFNDLPADKADVNFHSAIYNIRSALKIYEIKSDKPKRSKDRTYDYNPQYILYEDKTLRLNPDFYYKTDNIEFERLFEKSQLPAHTNEEKINYSLSAVELYKGDFLPGYYDSWCEELRVKYKNMYLTLCEELIKMLETKARFEEVIKYSELLLKEDKLIDSAHISIVNAYEKLGNIKMAKSRLDIMLKIYEDELGEKPQSKTLKKITHILSTAAGPP